MKLKGTILFALILTSFSCRKSNYVPPVYPLPPDSLMNWTVVGNIPGVALNDIWFTSASRGFTLGKKIYQTVDGGESWSAIPNTSAMNTFVNLFFLNSQTGFAQGFSQLAETVDGGNSWTVKTLPTDSAFTIFFADPLEGFYGDEGAGLKKTTNGGTSWVTTFSVPGISTPYYPYFLSSDTGFVVTGSGSFAATSNGGQTWKTVTGILPVNQYLQSYNQLFFQNNKIGFYACPSGVMKTTDGGKSWQNVLMDSVDGIYSNTINVVRFVDANTGYYKGSSAIYKTSDGGQSWNLNCQVRKDVLIGMYFLDADNGWACTSNGRILRLQQ